MRDFHLLGGCGCLTTVAGLGLLLMGIIQAVAGFPAVAGEDPARASGYVVGSICCCPGPVLLAGLGLLGAAVVRQRAQQQ